MYSVFRKASVPPANLKTRRIDLDKQVIGITLLLLFCVSIVSNPTATKWNAEGAQSSTSNANKADVLDVTKPTDELSDSSTQIRDTSASEQDVPLDSDHSPVSWNSPDHQLSIPFPSESGGNAPPTWR